MYKLPDEWESFYCEMKTRAKEYIRIKYWDIKEEILVLWLKNFSTDHEKFISALIIYRLIYRNREPRLSMYNQIVEVLLPNILEKNNIYTILSLDDFHYKLQYTPLELPFRFSTIVNVDSSPAKSGATLLREFKRFKEFHSDMEVSMNNLKNIDIKSIVLFDDFMGTGKQFETFMEIIKNEIGDIILIYCPLAAHIDGIKHINKLYPNIIISPVEILDSKNSFFSQEYFPKLAEDINIEGLQKVYENMIKDKPSIIKDGYLGFGEQALTYIFDMSSPNNSLPVLSNKDNNWERIFPR